jgi:hypothetical protein
MSGSKQSTKKSLLNLMFESAESVSISKDNAVGYLKEEGINVEGFVSEGMRRIKQMQLKANAANRKSAFLVLEEVNQTTGKKLRKAINGTS